MANNLKTITHTRVCGKFSDAESEPKGSLSVHKRSKCLSTPSTADAKVKHGNTTKEEANMQKHVVGGEKKPRQLAH